MTLGIEEYAELKLAVAEPVRSLLELGRLTQDQNAEHDARDLLARLAEDRFNLAVVGLFNRGKSSLINAMLGTARLPTGVVPLTSVITTVSYGDRERLFLHVRGSHLPREEPLDKLADFVSERGNPGNRLAIEHAELRLPVDLLRLGFFFVDTPGVGSAVVANTRTTREFLPEIDAAVFVTSFEAPLSEADIELYAELRQAVRSIFVVANKADLVTAAERDEALRYIRERLAQGSDGAAPVVLTISAKTGEGVAGLHDALSDFLRRDKLRELLLAVVRRSLGLADRIAVRIAMGESARADPIRADEQRDRFRSEAARVAAEKSRIFAESRLRVAPELIARMSSAIDEQCAAPDVVGASLRGWFEDHRQLLQSMLVEIARVDEQRLFALLRSLEHAAARLAGLSLDPSAAIGGRSIFEDALPPGVPNRPFVWPSPHRPFWGGLPLLRSRADQINRSTRAAAIDGYRRELTKLVEGYALAWVDQVAASFDRILGAMVAATEAAMTKPRDQRAAAELRQSRESLLRIAEHLESAQPATTNEEPRPIVDVRLGRCPFCVAVREAVFSFLSREQYDLHISTERRTERVANGFCALHAWEFEHIASPQGTCVAYAPVLAHLGDALSAFGARDSLAEMRDGFEALRPKRERCPACHAASLAEETVLRDLTRITSMVCLPHLALVLARTSDLEAARRMLDRQTTIMRRVSADMQNYALKFDAIRRYLLTDSESVAHIRGIAVVAGELGVQSVIPDNRD